LRRDRIIGQKEKPGSYLGIGEGKIEKVKRICRKATSQRNQTGGRKGSARDCPSVPLPMQRMWRPAKSTAPVLYQAFRELDACVRLASRFTAMLIVKMCEVKSPLDK
jgi:hypothetical protein